MFLLKGLRFGFPLIQRYGVQKQNVSHRIFTNRHAGLEIHYVLKGETTWVIGKPETTLHVAGGYFGIVPAQCVHRATDANGAPAIRIGVIFNPEPKSCPEGTPFTPNELDRIFSRFAASTQTPHRFSPRLASILRELYGTLEYDAVFDADKNMYLRVLSASLVHETYQILGRPEALAAGDAVIPKIIEWIGQHLTEDISIDRLIQLSGYGRSRFYSLFVANAGLSPNDYILRERINLAKSIILSSDDLPSMTDLSFRCGFNSPSAFTKSFHKIIGIPPSTFASKRGTI